MNTANLLSELNAFRAWADMPALKAWHSKRGPAELERFREIQARETETRINEEHAAAAAKIAEEAAAMNAKIVARSAALAAANKAAIAEADAKENAPTPPPAPVVVKGDKMPEANGIRRPKADTVCGSIWSFLDSKGFNVVIADALAFGKANSINEYTIRTQTSRWRKFHNIKM